MPKKCQCVGCVIQEFSSDRYSDDYITAMLILGLKYPPRSGPDIPPQSWFDSTYSSIINGDYVQPLTDLRRLTTGSSPVVCSNN